MDKTVVGFIGVGQMGSAIAQRLLSAGYSVIAADPDTAALARLRAQGAGVAASPREVADKASICFGCLPSADVCRVVTLGENGLMHGRAIRVYVECSTIGPRAMREMADALRQHGIELADAPISGGVASAHAGTLSTAVATAADVLTAIRPLLGTYAHKIVDAGHEPGLAQVYKLVNQGLTFASVVLSAEAIAAGVKLGADPSRLLEFLNASTGRNWATSTKFPDTVLRGHIGQGDLSIILKDMQLYLQMCRDAGCPAFVGAAADIVWQTTAALGGTSADLASVVTLYEQCTGVPIRDGAVRE
ncbi:NAD(P)-dependent oxidoreductase [Caballeronia sp. dw_19]|uniref:NAD(P)-dependent oxidoreductase n=1 Tax=Caballeronia sp. dw_19 TaxID=2719791 RepID=UPI001BD28FF7|nr:NAD(P)-dependent oxidoreductase [Caballeronia sp. dw_19]